jgi:hypothetical protein
MFPFSGKATANLLLLLLLAGCLTGCLDREKKEDAPAPFPAPAISTQELLLNNGGKKDWFLTAWVTYKNGITTNNFASLNACVKDDRYAFYRDRVEIYEPEMYCDSTFKIAHLYPGTWALQNNNSELTLKKPGLTTIFKIKQLTKTTLEISPIPTDSAQTTAYTTYTFTAQ